MTSQKKPSKPSLRVASEAKTLTLPKEHWKLVHRALCIYADGVNPVTKMKNVMETLEKFGLVLSEEFRNAIVVNGEVETANYKLAEKMAETIQEALES